MPQSNGAPNSSGQRLLAGLRYDRRRGETEFLLALVQPFVRFVPPLFDIAMGCIRGVKWGRKITVHGYAR
jgi:hypothetical protein